MDRVPVESSVLASMLYLPARRACSKSNSAQVRSINTSMCHSKAIPSCWPPNPKGSAF